MDPYRKHKAKVIRGVYIRGTAYGEGSIVDVSTQEFQELKSTNYVVMATPEEVAAAETPAAPEPAKAKAKA
jgi:hypothetical protein